MSQNKYDYYLQSGAVGAISKAVRLISGPAELWILIQILSPSLFGTYVTALVTINIITELSSFGLGNIILLQVPKIISEDHCRARRLAGQILMLTFLTVSTFMVLVIVTRSYINLIFQADSLTRLLFLLALIGPLSTLRDVHTQWLNAQERIIESFLLNNLIPNPIRLVGFTLVWILGLKIRAIVLVIFLERTLSVAPWFFREQLFKNFNLRTLTPDDYTYALQMMGNRFVRLMNKNIDILMLGWLGTSSMIAIYKLGASLASPVRHLHGLSGTLFKPRISRLIGESNYEKLQSEFTVLQKINTLALVLALGSIILMGQPVLSLFGKTYLASFSVLIILFIGRIGELATGKIEGILRFSGRSGWIFTNSFIAFTFNIVGNYFFIQLYGVDGAAWAWTGAMILENLFALLVVRYLYSQLFMPFIVLCSSVVLILSALLVLYSEVSSLLIIGFLLPFVFLFSWDLYPKFLNLWNRIPFV